jgi:hypothetical protein
VAADPGEEHLSIVSFLTFKCSPFEFSESMLFQFSEFMLFLF